MAAFAVKLDTMMRREWTGWIKNRQWGEFEKVAKTDPCQALADTVAELELGFPEKPDRKSPAQRSFSCSLRPVFSS